MTLYYAGSLTQIITLALLCWFREELDIERLKKYDAVEPVKNRATVSKK